MRVVKATAVIGVAIFFLVSGFGSLPDVSHKITKPGPVNNTAVRIIPPDRAAHIIAATSYEVMTCIKQKQTTKLAGYVHPEKGLRFSPYPCVNPITDLVFAPNEVKILLKDREVYRWGVYAGSGDPIKMTPRQYWKRFVYDRDYLNAPRVGYNTILGKGNARDNRFEVYPGAIIVEYHFPGEDPELHGLDWESLSLVFERYENEWYLVGIIHGQWTI